MTLLPDWTELLQRKDKVVATFQPPAHALTPEIMAAVGWRGTWTAIERMGGFIWRMEPVTDTPLGFDWAPSSALVDIEWVER